MTNTIDEANKFKTVNAKGKPKTWNPSAWDYVPLKYT